MIWRGLLNAIPECMKNRIQVNSKLNKGVFKIEFCRIKLVTIDEATEKQIKAGIKCIAFNDMTQNEFKAKRKLESIHGAIHKEEWVKIYTLYRSLNVDNHTKDLQYKILYRIVPTNKLLYKMRKVNSNMCDFCEIQIDTIEHALWECVVVKSFWLELFQIWNNLNHTDINPCKKNITFGILDESMSSINCVILYGKKFIQQSKKYNRPLNLSNFIENLKLTLHKADPSTEPIVNLIRTKYHDFEIPNAY